MGYSSGLDRGFSSSKLVMTEITDECSSFCFHCISLFLFYSCFYFCDKEDTEKSSLESESASDVGENEESIDKKETAMTKQVERKK